jgi:hypothetical protein
MFDISKHIIIKYKQFNQGFWFYYTQTRYILIYLNKLILSIIIFPSFLLTLINELANVSLFVCAFNKLTGTLPTEIGIWWVILRKFVSYL